MYAGALLPRLSRRLQSRGHEVIIYAPGPLRGVAVAGKTRIIPGSPFWTQRVLAAAVRRDPPDVLFLPIQMLPLFRPQSMRTVAVVHDLEFLHYPETYTLKNRLLLHFFTWNAVRYATRLIAVSQYTKDEVMRRYRRHADTITVVPHGVDTETFRERRAAEVRRRYQLPEHFILFVGALQPRKNIEGLVAAFEAFSRTPAPTSNPQDSVHLVLACGGGWKEEQILERIHRSPLHDRIHLFRRLSLSDLAGLYQAAQVFVLPSFSEGFGMPVLEAMAAGTPVVASRMSSLPEVVGDAALLVDPTDATDTAHAIERLIRDQSLRQQLVTRGHERAAQFTWERAAALSADVVEAAGLTR